MAPTESSIGTVGSTRDRQNASSASMPRFFRLVSQIWRSRSGVPLPCANEAPSLARMVPVLEWMKTFSRFPPFNAWPMSRWLCPWP